MVKDCRTKHEVLLAEYHGKNYTFESEYTKYPKDKKIKVILANRSVFTLRLDTIEKLRYTKMEEVDRRVLEDKCNSLQEMIWIHEQKIYIEFHDISKYDPLKDKLEKVIQVAGVLDWSDGVPDIRTNITSEKFNELPTQDQIEILIAKRKLFLFEYEAIERELKKILKKPNFKEFEKFWLAQHFYRIKNERGELYRILCWLYFYALPIDYPHRKELREKILGSDILFNKNVLKQMLYDETLDPPTLWWNLQEITSLERELQFIVRVLGRYPKEQILHEIDIIEVLKQKLPHVKEELENIPAELFAQRKEMLVEILKGETLSYRRNPGDYCTWIMGGCG